MELTVDLSFEEYESDWVKRYAIERSFAIIGEPMVRLRDFDPNLAANVTDFAEIIAFRNQLVRGYDGIDNQEVWSVVTDELPTLYDEVSEMLDSR